MAVSKTVTVAARLPPMHALRAFEAASRHQNFSRAAEELHVTHGAISHAIREMETEIGAKLMVRAGNTMRLTEAGTRLAGPVREALALLTTGLREARGGQDRPVVTVSTLPAFAARWLVPRLAEFYAMHKEVDIVLQVGTTLVDFAREPVDMAIRFGPGHWPGLAATRLFAESLFPVCSPAFLARHEMRDATGLLDVTLLRDVRHPWDGFFARVGVSAPQAWHGPAFDDGGLLLEAAIAGHGVALARGHLVADALRDGRLVRLFSEHVPSEWEYYIVHPIARPPTGSAAMFRDWLIGFADLC